MNAMTKSAAEIRRAARNHILAPRLESPFHERLMALSEVLRFKSHDPGAAITALRRVADEFGASTNGSTAA